MATLILSAAGAAAGSAIGGSVLGLSAAVIGRAAGATAGRWIDQKLMGAGSDVIEEGRVERFRLTGASEGATVTRVFGRMRVPGQVIWASNFLESRSTKRASGGKGGGSRQTSSVTSYSYSVSLAVALCDGEISHVGRIWADGQELSRRNVAYRVYPGTETQLPDPKIAAVEGSQNVTAYRGTAYVVFEDLDLSEFGNRVPQFSFEIVRPEQPAAAEPEGSMVDNVRAVALIPGTGEYVLATTPVSYAEGPGRSRAANVHTSEGQTDFSVSLDALQTELPKCGAVSLVVCWFGDDLRCGRTTLRPKVENKDSDGTQMPWSVSGLTRPDAQIVPQLNGAPVYGGTPSDQSVIEAIRDLNARGLKVMFYPFILMDQMSGNGLQDPWTGAADQPPLPWRGRITTSIAPDQPGSPDGTSAAQAEVATFFGTVQPSDFQISSGSVAYLGTEEWSMRRFVLHCAALCKAAGGVDAFCIGTEMVSLTQIRGAGNSFPAVSEFVSLASDVRSVVGPSVKLGYAADWTEYFGYTPQDGSGDRFFHLDQLWAHPEIDFVGIDNYMPLSDWRDGESHVDATTGWDSIYNLDYLKSNVAGGEGFDWYYPDAQAEAAQLRVPITDGAHNEHWIFRYKDLVSWWSNPHHERIGGIRQPGATSWIPQSKPIWFTELGCAAIDKGTNQPNKFLDPKSSESVLPRGSNGARDDLIQMQYLRAILDYWKDPANNPVSALYGGTMVDMSRAHVWCWDARPFPWFPGLGDVWDDGPNYLRGHWLNGRTGSQLLSVVVREICQESGLVAPDLSRLYGLVLGYAVTDAGSARSALDPLVLGYGFDSFERDGKLTFRNRSARVDAQINEEEIARNPDHPVDLQRTRDAETEVPSRVRLSYVTADGNYEIKTVETSIPGGESERSTASELNLVLSMAEARALTERWLAEARVARETAKFALPPSWLSVAAGDVVELPGVGGPERYRIDRSDQLGLQVVEAIRVEPAVYLPGVPIEEIATLRAARAPQPPAPVFLDLPMLSSEDVAHAPYIAVAAHPWPGDVAVFSSGTDGNYKLNTLVQNPASIGITRTPLLRAAANVLDLGPAFQVEMSDGALSSVPFEEMLSGANAMAIGDGTPENWEIFQFERADLVGPDTYELSRRLRGQLGTEAAIPDQWPAGSWVVLLDAALQQISLSSGARGLERHYRIGPANQPYTDGSYVHRQDAFYGIGLRPYSPSHIGFSVDAAGNHRIGWIRRTRIDGDLWDLADVPLGEAREEYVLRVRSGGAIRREATVTVPSWSYSTAARTSDGVGTSYTFEVAQVSERFGPGPFTRMTING
ncbi:MAG: glycoside hydrolase/phage tail family protein [Rhodobacteraceae bacterium]|nr:glycoside hydrolase/phage tail family protein [Paracoccaceae bacterium]